MDALKKIFDMQTHLAKTMPDAGSTCGERTSNLCIALTHKVIELHRLTNWKWWKKPIEMDIIDARKEIADIVHYTIQIAIELGMNHDDLFEEYVRTNDMNHKKRADGYHSASM